MNSPMISILIQNKSTTQKYTYFLLFCRALCGELTLSRCGGYILGSGLVFSGWVGLLGVGGVGTATVHSLEDLIETKAGY